jgi:hypothetical protein
VQVVMLEKMLNSIPRGKHRSNLTQAGRIQSLHFKRSMSVSEVDALIRQCFKDVQSWKVLEGVNNVLSASKNQSLDGEAVISRKGSLYLCQEVCTCTGT